MHQCRIELGGTGLDLSRFIEYNLYPPELENKVRISGMPGQGRRAGKAGTAIASLAAKRSSGYSVQVAFDDVMVESFAPTSVLPAITESYEELV